MTEKLSIEISWATLWRVALFLGIIVLLYLARGTLGVFIIAAVVSLGLDPIVGFLQKIKIPRILGTLFVFLFGLFILGVVIYFILPIVISEVGAFLEHFNKVVSDFLGFGLPQAFIKNFSLTLDQVVNFFSSADISITGAIGSVFSKVVFVFIAIIASFYLTVDEGGVERMLKVILPDIYERQALLVFNRFKVKIRRWFGAQFVLSLIVGVVVGLGLWLLGVRYALALGVIAAVFELVPLIGPVITGLFAFLIAVSDSFSLGLYAVLFFFVVQQLENHILIPFVMGKTMQAHPVIVIISLLAGAEVAGFVGVILAVPIAVLAQEIFNFLAERKSHKPALGI